MDRINGANTVDIGSGNRGFRQQNVAAGLAGTELAAAWFNAIQEEILTVIEGAGIVPSAESWTQLRQAITAMISAAVPEVDMSPYLQKAGGTMLGSLLLVGAPEESDEAANKAYVDGLVAGLLARAGGTMTGFLSLHAAPTAPMHAANKGYVDGLLGGEAHLFGSSGYQKFASGLILQWVKGATDPASGDEFATTYTWPLSFPAACLGAWVSIDISNVTQNASQWYQTVGFSQSQVVVLRQDDADDNWNATTVPYILGIGY